MATSTHPAPTPAARGDFSAPRTGASTDRASTSPSQPFDDLLNQEESPDQEKPTLDALPGALPVGLPSALPQSDLPILPLHPRHPLTLGLEVAPPPASLPISDEMENALSSEELLGELVLPNGSGGPGGSAGAPATSTAPGIISLAAQNALHNQAALQNGSVAQKNPENPSPEHLSSKMPPAAPVALVEASSPAAPSAKTADTLLEPITTAPRPADHPSSPALSPEAKPGNQPSENPLDKTAISTTSSDAKSLENQAEIRLPIGKADIKTELKVETKGEAKAETKTDANILATARTQPPSSQGDPSQNSDDSPARQRPNEAAQQLPAQSLKPTAAESGASTPATSSETRGTPRADAHSSNPTSQPTPHKEERFTDLLRTATSGSESSTPSTSLAPTAAPRSAFPSPATPQASAAQFLQRIEEAAQALRTGNPNRVELDVPLSDSQSVRVRLEMRAGELLTTIRSESRELRELLERAWPEFSARNADRGLRIGEAFFQSSDPNLSQNKSQGDPSSGQRQPGQDPASDNTSRQFREQANPRSPSNPGTSGISAPRPATSGDSSATSTIPTAADPSKKVTHWA